MKCALITPIDVLPMAALVDEYHMILPSVAVASEAYRAFYKDLQGYKILDNGEAEGEHFEPDVLFDLAYELGVNELVIPDMMGDAQGTIQKAYSWMRIAKADFRYMGVIQGASIQEFIRCAAWWDSNYDQFPNPEGFTFGVPRFMNTFGEYSRTAFIEELCSPTNAWVRDITRGRVHALGSWYPFPMEAMMLRTHQIRGIDTSLPAVFAANTIPITSVGMKPSRASDFFTREYPLNSMLWKETFDNVRTYLNWCGVEYGPSEGKTSPISGV